ncbi:MAG: ArsI/CadI family heavy metal resistance metalloenzyme [Xanthomonadales bacterium]|nr:ArsI/CadI family heavy metal resistance metalloenzyme [Xanthomonadales bacterium]
MKRFHVNLSVKNLDESVAFYNRLFGASPSVTKKDYAKWMLDDPQLNFSVTTRHGNSGINHLGLQVDSVEELSGLRARMVDADQPILDQPEVTCCYANSAKAWTQDPDGVSWEGFFTDSASEQYGEDIEPSLQPEAMKSSAGCCG